MGRPSAGDARTRRGRRRRRGERRKHRARLAGACQVTDVEGGGRLESVAVRTWSCHPAGRRGSVCVGGRAVGVGERGWAGKRRWGRERNLGHSPRARAPPSARLSCARRVPNGPEILGDRGGGGARGGARVPAGGRGGAPAGRGWAPPRPWVSFLKRGAGATLLTSDANRQRGAAPAQLRGDPKMVRTLLVTVRIRRPSGPPRVRAFVVQIPRRSGERAEPDLRAAVALVLTLLRSQRRARQPHPGRAGRKGREKSRGNLPRNPPVWCDLTHM